MLQPDHSALLQYMNLLMRDGIPRISLKQIDICPLREYTDKIIHISKHVKSSDICKNACSYTVFDSASNLYELRFEEALHILRDIQQFTISFSC